MKLLPRALGIRIEATPLRVLVYACFVFILGSCDNVNHHLSIRNASNDEIKIIQIYLDSREIAGKTITIPAAKDKVDINPREIVDLGRGGSGDLKLIIDEKGKQSISLCKLIVPKGVHYCRFVAVYRGGGRVTCICDGYPNEINN